MEESRSGALQESFVDDHEDLLFTDLALFNQKLADWLIFYNTQRPHFALGQQPPLSSLLQHQPECQRWWTHTRSCHLRLLGYHGGPLRGSLAGC
ncbi:MAG: integrase core domain-containing protein [Pseudomonadota bacterium]